VRSSTRYRLGELGEEGDEVRASTRHQLDELLGNRGFLRTVDLISKEVYHVWNVSDRDAYGVVLSAIGEPATLACVHAALSPRPNLALAKVIIRRRVIDLLRKDARPNNHCSLPPAADGAEPDGPPGSFDEPLESTPRVQLEVRQVVNMVRTALDGFAAQGDKQHQQAQLLQRYMIDEVGYDDLSVELTCSKNALRVRVHKAIMALRKYVQICHPDLEQLLEGRSLKPAGPDAAELPAVEEAADRPCPHAAASPGETAPFRLAPRRKSAGWAHGSDHAIKLPAAAGDGAQPPVIVDGL
jgi:DNA-directed RNA polymerase specialized sigma24 family protein